MSCWRSKGFYYNLYMSQFRRGEGKTGGEPPIVSGNGHKAGELGPGNVMI